MMKKIFTFLGIVFSLSVFAQTKPEPKSYVAYRTTEKIEIDGKDGEKSWKSAEFSDDFIDIEGKKIPYLKTNVKMLYDDEYFYFFAKMEDPHIWATLKQRDTVIYHNNDFEIFLDPDNDSHNYYEFEINALNTVWDLFLTKPYRERNKVLDGWDINGLKTAVHIEGTLNTPTDVDKFWCVEIAIPWAAMREAHMQNNIPTGKFWRVNFSRVHWDFELNEGKYQKKRDEKGKNLPEYNWVWSPQWKISMHEPELWGYVYFSEKKVGEKDHFEVPKDEGIKRYLYDLYHFSKSNKKSVLAKKVKEGIIIFKEKITATLNDNPFFWNISVKSPFSGKTLVIMQDGKQEEFER
ncbi:carbohydrate-binding family 9-like protein [Capnocytophaga cynodegmi]|uniref:carbohydrate-binding family 9-like protein n=1 Tax=Capnocytophaga cynodegmi TaxID=28189 RepID=UPI001BB3D4AB|nr:carbohydrate-binding family 9-like protein [Capnocytophaga cynodegmi]